MSEGPLIETVVIVVTDDTGAVVESGVGSVVDSVTLFEVLVVDAVAEEPVDVDVVDMVVVVVVVLVVDVDEVEV